LRRIRFASVVVVGGLCSCSFLGIMADTESAALSSADEQMLASTPGIGNISMCSDVSVPAVLLADSATFRAVCADGEGAADSATPPLDAGSEPLMGAVDFSEAPKGKSSDDIAARGTDASRSAPSSRSVIHRLSTVLRYGTPYTPDFVASPDAWKPPSRGSLFDQIRSWLWGNRYLWLFFVVCTVMWILLATLSFNKLSTNGVLTIIVVTVLLGVLAFDRVSTVKAFIVAVTLFVLLEIITVRQAISGFANEGMLTVAALFALAEGVTRTGAFDPIFNYLLPDSGNLKVVLLRVCVPACILSAFLNNTPIVAILIPVLLRWCRRTGVAPSKVLMPMNTAVLLGGTITVIGTSTNLVVTGLTEQFRLKDRNGEPVVFSVFSISAIGAVYAVVGIVYVVLCADWLLPKRETVLDEVSGNGAAVRETSLVESETSQVSDSSETQRSTDALELHELRGSSASLLSMEAQARAASGPKAYSTLFRVPSYSPLVGRALETVGLRPQELSSIVEIIRANGDTVVRPAASTIIEAEDWLRCAADTRILRELYRSTALVPVNPSSRRVAALRHKRNLVEVVLSRSSPLLGKTVRQADFPGRFGAAVLAVVSNADEQTSASSVVEHSGSSSPSRDVEAQHLVDEIVLESGVTLLLEVPVGFAQTYAHDSTFALVAEVENSRPPLSDWRRMLLVLALVVVAISLAASETLSLLVSSVTAILIMIAAGCLTGEQAIEAIKLDVMGSIALAFAVSTALEVSGVAGELAGFFIDVFGRFGNFGVLLGIYIGGTMLSEIVTNNAAAALTFPIIAAPGTGILARTQLNPYAALTCLMLAASTSFLTPIGYQTNLMIRGPGGYRFFDYTRFGGILQIALIFVGAGMCNLIYPS
jgi:di/tricarboxylate transporter